VNAEVVPGTDDPPHVARLRRLAERTGGLFWSAASPEALVPAFAAILEALRTRYVLQFEPAGRVPGLHRLEVKLKGRRGRVHCRESYFVGGLP
jgi:hypothetical protein